ncbi:MAG: DNA-3-methyladenine glycosylase [Chitinophagales bacterium]
MKTTDPISILRGSQVERIAPQLIGMTLSTTIDGITTSGIIREVEAYSFKERGCHAFDKKYTPRTSTMFQEGGCLYVYLIYGIYPMLNLVTGPTDWPEAVLIRSIEPVEGIPTQLKRRGKDQFHTKEFSGPGKVAQALGIKTKHNGLLLGIDLIELQKGESPRPLIKGPRIGIDYAGQDALLPWRWADAQSNFVSHRKGLV